MNKLKIIFFGSPYYAVPILEKIISLGHNLELVISQGSKKVKRGNLNLILLKKIGLAFVYKDVLKSTCIKFLEKNLHL